MRNLTKEKTTKIILHVVVWAVILGLPVYSAGRFRMGTNFLMTYYTFATISALIFYVNYLILIPKLFFHKKRYRYYLSAIVVVFCSYFVSDFANDKVFSYISKHDNQQQLYRQAAEERRPGQLPPRGGMIRILIPHAHLIGYASSSVLMVFLSLGLRVLERQSKIEKMHEEMEKTKLKTELAFLKNQISPHFFFNTLNNIYSLIGRNNDDSKDAVIKLSKLMRYVINESGQDNRPLADEIEFMNNYIDLMKLRLGTKTRLSVSFPVVTNDLMIAHLLFISLIENAFKYGISVQEESYINISLSCEGNTIFFKCENGLPESNNGSVLGSSGIGLENFKKRLGLLYDGRYELSINKSKNEFVVDLIIHL